MQRSGLDSRRYQIWCEVVGLERDPLSLVSTTEELRWRKSSESGLENREHGRRDPSRWPRGPLYQQKLTLTSPTSGGHSVNIVRSRNDVMMTLTAKILMNLIDNFCLPEMFIFLFDMIKTTDSGLNIVTPGLSLWFILILSTDVYIFFVVSFLADFPTKPYMHSSSTPCVLHALPISSFFTGF
jgi:hypothetical protein